MGLGDNLLLAMGTMLEEAEADSRAGSIIRDIVGYCRGRGNMCWKKICRAADGARLICNQLHVVSRRTSAKMRFTRHFGHWPNAWLKRIRLNAVRRELISRVVAGTTVRKYRDAVGILASGAICLIISNYLPKNRR